MTDKQDISPNPSVLNISPLLSTPSQYSLTWLHQILVGALQHGRIFSCSMWDLVLGLGIEPRPSALGAWSLSHQTTREVPTLFSPSSF